MIAKQGITTWDSTLLKRLLLVFLIIAGLYFAKNFLIPIIIAVFLSTLFLPFCKWLEKHGLHRAIASLLCLLALLLLISAIGFFFGWKVQRLAGDFSLIRNRSIEFIGNIQHSLYQRFGLTPVQQIELLATERPVINEVIPAVAGSLVNFLTHVVLVGAYFFLVLYYRSHLRTFILSVAKTGQTETETMINQVAHVSQHYLLGLAKMIVCLWLLYGIAFSALGVKDALFFAILCGLLEIIPYVGNFTGTLITVLVAAVHGASPALLVGIVLVYASIQFIQGWILEPLIVGPQVRINPLFTILALVVGQLIWGIPGVFLAIPLIAMFKIVSDHVESLKPYGFLVGEVMLSKHSPSLYDRLKLWMSKGKKRN